MKKVKSGATEGRILFRRWRLGGFEWRSDIIAKDYMRRWTFTTPWGMLRPHHILRSDDRAHFHDHPMDFTSFILKGGYIEHRPGCEPVRHEPGSIVRRRAEDLHALELLERDAWTFVVAGPIRREWGFQTEDGWVVAGLYDAWKRAKSSASEPFGLAVEAVFRDAETIEVFQRNGELVARVKMPSGEVCEVVRRAEA